MTASSVGARETAAQQPADPAEPASRRSASQEPMAQRRSRWLLLGTLLALLAVYVPLLGPSLLGREVFAETGLVLRFEPWQAVASLEDQRGVTIAHDTMDWALPNAKEFVSRVRDGDWPLWTPLVAGGGPLAAVSEHGLVSPLALPYLLLPFEMAPAWVRLLEVLVAVGFMHLFLRRLTLSPGPALLGGLLYSCTAFLVLWNNWPQAQVASLIPALFWSVERALQLRRPAAVVPVALALASMLLASFPAVVVYTLYLLGPYVLVRTLASRPRVREVARSWSVAGAGLVLGVALAAFQVVPFLQHLGDLDLSYREQSPAAHAPFSALVTLVVPYAFGSETDQSYFGYRNTIETIAFVGVVCAVLALVAVGLRVRLQVPRGVLGLLCGTVVTLVLVAWSSDTALGLAQRLPFVGSSFIGRTRAVLGFALAVLAAIGAEKLVRLRPGDRALTPWAVVPLAAALAGSAWALRGALAAARDADRLEVMVSASVLPACVLAGLVLCLLVVRARRTGLVALLVLPALVAVEGLAFIAPRWPSEDPAQFYPRTGVHAFLADNLGADRYAAAGAVMFPSTTSYYGLRAVSGHAFQQPTWKQVVARIDPTVTQGPTLSFVGGSSASAVSPLLDRLAARYYVTSVGSPVFGRTVPPPAPAGSVRLPPGQQVRLPLAAGPRRALVLRLTAATAGSAPGRLVATFRDGAGEVVGAAERPGLPAGQTGPLWVPVAGETGPLTRARSVTLAVTGVSLTLGAGPDGEVLVGEVLPADDGLSLAYGGESVVYERLRALPRVRFASSAVAPPPGTSPLDLLASGELSDEQVLLAQPPSGPEPQAPGGGQVEVVEDSGDVLRARATSASGGWVVIADALQQSGWTATVDGEQAPLLHADHAGVAVAVPAGRSEVVLSYDPPGLRVGAAVSGVTALLLLALAVTGRLRSRRAGYRSARPDGGTTGSADGRAHDGRQPHGVASG